MEKLDIKYNKDDKILITSKDFGLDNHPATIITNGWEEDVNTVMYKVKDSNDIYDVMGSEITGLQLN